MSEAAQASQFINFIACLRVSPTSASASDLFAARLRFDAGTAVRSRVLQMACHRRTV